MTRKARDKIAAGLREAIAVARGEEKPARMYAPQEIDVKAIRKKTGMSQEAFAHFYGFTIEQVRAWEQERNRPIGGVRAYLTMIDADHKGVARLLEFTRKTSAA
jgi:putative transcriptional regulator